MIAMPLTCLSAPPWEGISLKTLSRIHKFATKFEFELNGNIQLLFNFCEKCGNIDVNDNSKETKGENLYGLSFLTVDFETVQKSINNISKKERNKLNEYLIGDLNISLAINRGLGELFASIYNMVLLLKMSNPMNISELKSKYTSHISCHQCNLVYVVMTDV